MSQANSMSPSTAPAGVRQSLRWYWGAYRAEIGCEIRRYLRTPSFMLPVLLFPALLYVLFGIVLNHTPDARRWLLASYVCFGVMSPGLYGFGISLAMERSNGLLQLKRVQPIPPGAYLLAKLVMAILVGLLVGGMMLALGLGLAGVHASLNQVVWILALAGLGVIPFAALGMYLGSLLQGQGGTGLINLVYLPMAALSGLWAPLSVFPKWLQQLAPLWPAWHLEQLALDGLGVIHGACWPHLLVLLGYTAALTGLAVHRLQKWG